MNLKEISAFKPRRLNNDYIHVVTENLYYLRLLKKENPMGSYTTTKKFKCLAVLHNCRVY